MEVFGLVDIPVWITQFLCLLLLIYIYAKYPGTIWKRLGVASPPSTAFFGHLSQFSKHGMSRTLAHWEKLYGKTFGILVFRQPVLVVSDLEVVKQILVTDFNNYTDRVFPGSLSFLHPLMKKAIIFNKGADWKRVRHTLNPLFSTMKVKQLLHYINTSAREMKDLLRLHVDSNTHLDAQLVFSSFSLDIATATTFGLEVNTLRDWPNIAENNFYQNLSDVFIPTKLSQRLMTVSGMFPFLAPLFDFLRIKVSFLPVAKIEFVKELVTKIRNQRKNDSCSDKQLDFLQFLFNAEYESESGCETPVGKKLTEEEIVAQTVAFVFGGLDTNTHTLMWLSYEVTRKPDVQAKLLAEIEDVIGEDDKDVDYEQCMKLKYMEAVIKETLRLYPVGSTIGRHVVKGKATVCGVKVPPEVAIVIPIYKIHRDPELFEDPMTFNPERFLKNDHSTPAVNPLTFLSFGTGPRQCIGVRLAIVQLKIALVHILRTVRFEDVCPKKVDFADTDGNIVPKEPFKFILKER